MDCLSAKPSPMGDLFTNMLPINKDLCRCPNYRRSHLCIWLGCCMRANSMYEISSNQPSLVACTGLMWCATGLRFYYIWDTDPASKLAIGIGHLWSWAGFMAAHIWDINFAVICELHHYSGYNNEPVCPKCSFKLILYNLTWYHVTFLWHNWDHWDNLSSPCRDLIEPCWHTVNSCFFGKIYGPNMSSHKSIPGP